MNEMNQLEKQLQSWIPRRPSARLRHRLFAAAALPIRESGARVVTRPASFALLPTWVKLAPAVCILLLVSFFYMPRHEHAPYLAVAGGSNVFASLSSNVLAYCTPEICSEGQNVWSKVTFDWTSTQHSGSTTGSFPLWKTNIQKL